MKLTIADVNRLLEDPSGDVRAETASKVAETFAAGDLSQTERETAEAIFRIMLHDAELRVRRAMSEHLKHDPAIPRDLALALAQDVSEVARPMLEFSKVLSDEDLIEIVRSQSPEHQQAVARRETLAPTVAHEVVKHGDESAVAVLMTNRRVELPEQTLQLALDRFGDSERVKRPIVMRPTLPIRVAERLVALVSDSLRERLVMQHELSPDVAADLVLQSRERATVILSASGEVDRPTLARMVHEMNRNGRLTPTILVRALCLGDLDFFESAMAELSGVPVENAYALIHDAGGRGLAAIAERCRIPEHLMPLVRIGVSVAREVKYDGQPGDRERFVSRVLERILTHFERDGIENIDYLIGRLGRVGQAA